MKVCILNNNNNENNHLLNNISDGYILKRDFSLINSFLKIITACIYAFGLGYRLFFTGDNFIELGIKFLPILAITYFPLKVIYNFLKAFLFPNVFNKDIVQLKINPFNMHITISSTNPIEKKKILLSLLIPCLIFIIPPNIFNLISEFNIFLYAATSVGTIISIEDLLFFILIIKNKVLGEILIVTTLGYINSSISLSETSAELNENLQIDYKGSVNSDSEKCNDEICYQVLEDEEEDIEKN